MGLPLNQVHSTYAEDQDCCYRALAFRWLLHSLLAVATVLTIQRHTHGVQIRYRLEVTDTDGNQVDDLRAGQQFYLNAFIQDVTASEGFSGPFTTYRNIAFDANIASIIGDITYGPKFPNIESLLEFKERI